MRRSCASLLMVAYVAVVTASKKGKKNGGFFGCGIFCATPVYSDQDMEVEPQYVDPTENVEITSLRGMSEEPLQNLDTQSSLETALITDSEDGSRDSFGKRVNQMQQDLNLPIPTRLADVQDHVNMWNQAQQRNMNVQPGTGSQYRWKPVIGRQQTPRTLHNVLKQEPQMKKETRIDALKRQALQNSDPDLPEMQWMAKHAQRSSEPSTQKKAAPYQKMTVEQHLKAWREQQTGGYVNPHNNSPFRPKSMEVAHPLSRTSSKLRRNSNRRTTRKSEVQQKTQFNRKKDPRITQNMEVDREVVTPITKQGVSYGGLAAANYGGVVPVQQHFNRKKNPQLAAVQGVNSREGGSFIPTSSRSMDIDNSPSDDIQVLGHSRLDDVQVMDQNVMPGNHDGEKLKINWDLFLMGGDRYNKLSQKEKMKREALNGLREMPEESSNSLSRISVYSNEDEFEELKKRYQQQHGPNAKSVHHVLYDQNGIVEVKGAETPKGLFGTLRGQGNGHGFTFE